MRHTATGLSRLPPSLDAVSFKKEPVHTQQVSAGQHVRFGLGALIGQLEIDDIFHTAPELSCVPAQCRGPGDHGVIGEFDRLIALTVCHASVRLFWFARILLTEGGRCFNLTLSFKSSFIKKRHLQKKLVIMNT